MNNDIEVDHLGEVAYEKYQNLVAEAQTPIYIGSEMTVLEMILKTMQAKVENRWSNKSFNDILRLKKLALPKENKYPDSYQDAKKVLKNLGLGYETIHACEKGCIVLQRIHGISKLSRRLRHPVDGEVWQNFDREFPEFSKDIRNVQLGLVTDGFNPFGVSGLSHSTWPIIVMTYNFSPSMCMKKDFNILSMLISGPKSPGKCLNVFMRPLMNELKILWDTGVPTYDRHDGSSFIMKAIVLWTISDFPGLGMLGGLKIKGYKACPLRLDDVDAKHLAGRMSYQGHRKWLPKTHLWRKQKDKFNGQIEWRDAPRPLSGLEILEEIDKHEYPTLSLHPLLKLKSTTQRLCWSYKTIFYELPYWKTFSQPYSLDVMHIEKNVFDNIIGTILGLEGKTKDDVKAREGLEKQGVRKHLWKKIIGSSSRKDRVSQAPYTVLPEHKIEILEMMKDSKQNAYTMMLMTKVGRRVKNPSKFIFRLRFLKSQAVTAQTITDALYPPKLPHFDYSPPTYDGPSADEILKKRKEFLSPSIFHLYEKPLHLVDGKMQYLFDANGRRYLDVFGGIAMVSCGHCHPDVVDAIVKRTRRLQHPTILYLNNAIADFAEALAGKMPGDLKVVFFTNSGTEANELALMMARLYTGCHDVVSIRNAYHGNAPGTMASTAQRVWKFNVVQTGVHHAMNPDPYRGVFGSDGEKYAKDLEDLIEFGTCGRVGAFISEAIQGVGGIVEMALGYLPAVYKSIKKAGGLCIADEVQSGFARTGSHFWGFESHGVVPDIVTMAKGIGNGIPLGAVVTTPEIAQVLTQSSYFNTFGGNPVCTAAGLAVLNVIEKENLQENAFVVGSYLKNRLASLMEKYEIIGDVRGSGLMLGVELVTDRQLKTPAKAETLYIMDQLKDLGVLVGKGGIYGNVFRITPPLCFTKDDADFLVDAMDYTMSKM
ncbi:hypothetical protein QQ045_032970 [Rhodiola kirilowii]